MRELLLEIWESIKRNKLRTCLTGLAVAWGIFMLIVLLGAGNGLINASAHSQEDFASNTMMVGGDFTTKAYDGLKAGRYIMLNNKDIELTESHIFSDHIDDVTAEIRKGPFVISYKNFHSNIYLSGCYPKIFTINKLSMIVGRFIDQPDMEMRRKSIVIPSELAKQFLNGGSNYEQLIGEYLKFNNSMYRVVGIYKTQENMRNNFVFIPFPTLQMLFNEANYEDYITFTFHGLQTEEENEEFRKNYRSVINTAHRAAPDDEGAIWIWNRFTQNMQMEKGMGMIKKSLWIVGLLTLLGGIVGVSNIMLITVKERTHEFGIRKAIGATPADIMKLIVAESISITAVFGYVGMVLGLIACEVMDAAFGHASFEIMGENFKVFENPTVDLSVAIGVTIVLVIAGTAAGLSPAIKAARILPIEALRNE